MSKCKNEQNGNELVRAMKSRHLLMLSLGGVIGTGLFLNIGLTIHQAGSLGAIIGYLFGGLVLFMVMSCLGELAVYMPVSGSFQTYASKFISPSVGFALGCIYFIGVAATLGVEVTAASMMMKYWFTDIPVWIWALIFVIVLFVMNAVSTKTFAESEFWFAGIKILAVAAFIIIGVLVLIGWIPINNKPESFVHTLFPDKLFPNGIFVVFTTMMNVIFSYQGSEVIGIAAGESKNPEKNIPKAIKSIVFRIIFFYIISILVLAAIFPANSLGVDKSPFVTLLTNVGIPLAPDIMNLVVLTAILSVGNSCLYAASRIVFSMSKEGMAPSMFSKVNKRKIPMNALLITLLFSFCSLLTVFMEASVLYALLVSVAGIAVTISWMGITLSHYMFRRQFIRNGGNLEDLKFKAILYPFMPLFCFFFCLIILLFLAWDPEQSYGLLSAIIFFVLCMVYYQYKISPQLSEIKVNK